MSGFEVYYQLLLPAKWTFFFSFLLVVVVVKRLGLHFSLFLSRCWVQTRMNSNSHESSNSLSTENALRKT